MKKSIKKFLINMFYSAKIVTFAFGILGLIFYLCLAIHAVWLHLVGVCCWVVANPKGALEYIIGFMVLCGFFALYAWFEEWVRHEEEKSKEEKGE